AEHQGLRVCWGLDTYPLTFVLEQDEIVLLCRASPPQGHFPLDDQQCERLLSWQGKLHLATRCERHIQEIDRRKCPRWPAHSVELARNHPHGSRPFGEREHAHL